MKTLKVPMFHDNHNHVALNIALNNSLNTRNITYNEAINTISKMPENEINVVTGWMFYDFNRKDLESLPPVFICDNFLHAFFLNKKAKDMIRPKHPLIAENIEDSHWVEKFLPEILSVISELKETTKENIANYFETLLSKGIYSVEDMLSPNGNFIDLITEAGFDKRCKFWMAPEFYIKYKNKYKSKLEGIKIFLDGALTPETASISGYLSGSKGMLIHSDSELLELLRLAENEKKKIAIHSVGDIGVEQLLNTIEKNNIKIPGLRLEHAMFITREQAIRAKYSGIILSMQPNFSFDSVIFKNKIKEEFLSRNNPFRMLIDEIGFIPGKNLIFSSDGMPSGMEFAVESALFPPYEGQKLTIEELINGYSIKNAKNITLKIENNKVSILQE